jgi:hypothetical protein
MGICGERSVAWARHELGNLIARQTVPLDGVACCLAAGGRVVYSLVNNTCVLLKLLTSGVTLNMLHESLDALH